MQDDPEEPPGAVSDQNQEEAEGEHEDGGFRRREPDPGEEEHEGGEAGEGSQSTGHPQSAG